ncbi:MAG: zinc-ribbon domain-containing protein [Actinobacteria bacterium]|nr:zinc-ribbon domain-containing protein [Actinomycetota bacterium]
MRCPECGTENPEVARFCLRCGHGFAAAAAGRSRGYAIQTAENVRQFALISTIMPHTNRESADAYRWALLLAAGAVIVFTVAGILPMAILSAAFLVPLAYLIYIYDINLWEDAPASVVAMLFVVTGALSTLVSLVFFRWVFQDEFRGLLVGLGGRAGGIEALPISGLLLFAVVLPIVAEIVKNIGPVFLASRPKFDDMIDGLTFGVAAGTAYAAFETLVAFWPVFTSGQIRTTDGLAEWTLVILNLMVVKSLIYGTATGIAAAAFSGRGEGYDGFTPSYFANFAFAAVMNVLYWLGVRLLAYAPFGQALGLLWGVVILAVLVIRVRVMLHTALIEAAIEDAANDRRAAYSTNETGFCPECEMQLLPDSAFCIACGESVRATSATARHRIREAPAGDAATTGGAA